MLIETLGRDFAGVLGSDCFSAYLKYMRVCSVTLQLCLAHLIREVKFLSEHPDAATAAYGGRFLAALKELFGVIHRRGEMTPRGFRRELGKAIASELNPLFKIHDLVVVDSLPRTASNKLMRRELRAGYGKKRA